MPKKKLTKEEAKKIPKVGATDEELDKLYDISFFDRQDIPKMNADEAIAYINTRLNKGKKIKRNVLKKASDAGNPFLLRRPFGIASLDMSIGGGMPAGGITQIGAPAGIGKNALAGAAISRNQWLYGEDSRIAWVWTEIPVDKSHLRINGAVISSSDDDIYLENADRVKKGYNPLTDDEVFRSKISIGEFLIADEGSTEERLQCAVDLIAANNCQLIVVDSIAAAVSKYRVDTPLDEEPKQSSEAAMLSEFQRLCWHAFSNPLYGRLNFTTMIVINQVRANRGARGTFAREWKVGGPYAIKHGKLLDITLKPGKRIPEKGAPKVGKIVGWEISKGKAGCHEGPSGELNYYYKSGFDRYVDLVNCCKSMDIIQQRGRYYEIIDADGEVLKDKISGGAEAVVNMVYEDEEMFDKLYYACLQKADVSCLHKL